MGTTRQRHFGSGYSYFGEDTTGQDVKVFGDTTGKYIFWDASADTFYIVGTLDLDGSFSADNILLVDSETLTFGTGSDVVIQWDGTNLIVAAAADNSLIEIGDAAATQLSFDLKWYANEASGASFLYFDASANLIYTTGVDLQFLDNDLLVFGTGAGAAGDINIKWDATNLVMASVAVSSAWLVGAAGFVINTTQHGTVTVGVNDTGYDVTFFGATAGAKMLWDESADQLIITGNATDPALQIAGAGSKSAVAYAAAGTAWADAGTPAFIADQMYARINVGGTVYRLPLWADV